MARKKKQSRKYMPKNEFRYNNNNIAMSHPHYVFGETRSGKYKSLGLTTHPKKEVKHYELKKNPNPNDKRHSYLQYYVHTASPKYYGEVLEGWSFGKEDMPIVRKRIKDYKKSINRKPKLWYVKKLNWNKKNKK